MEARAQTADLSLGAEQEVRGDRHGGEGNTSSKNGQNLLSINPSYQFALLSYFFSVFLLLFASSPSFTSVSELRYAFSREIATGFVLFCFAYIFYF